MSTTVLTQQAQYFNGTPRRQWIPANPMSVRHHILVENESQVDVSTQRLFSVKLRRQTAVQFWLE